MHHLTQAVDEEGTAGDGANNSGEEAAIAISPDLRRLRQRQRADAQLAGRCRLIRPE
jgi:hypothetical protein